jgi:peptidoglycan L-alanyl-D-glutamate endopeptidase CwlK
MNYANKIKNTQYNAEPAWMNIYHLLFASSPSENNINLMIKTVQQKLKVKEKGKPGIKTWRALYQLITGNSSTVFKRDDTTIDSHNETILQDMTKEIVPFAKELIHLAAEQGIYVRLITGLAQKEMDNSETSFSIHNFGLAFDIGIFSQNVSGEFIYNGDMLVYANVSKLAESIGLIWAADRKNFTNLSRFELRPAWSLRMSEGDMVKELYRRKESGLNLLAILD